jgi:RNA polymerase sigma-70 factor (ECF subfamily)
VKRFLGVGALLGVVELEDDAAHATADQAFSEFVESHGERLRRVLVAGYGVEVGNDVCADALAYAWEHWERVRNLDNPIGYLYRVAQSSTRRHRRWSRRVALPIEPPPNIEAHDPELSSALSGLTQRQRQCVVLVHVYDWTYQQTADALNLPLTSVRNHVHRGLAALRRELES